jgi:hypothetical protein
MTTPAVVSPDDEFDDSEVAQEGDEVPLEGWRANAEWRAAWLRAVAKSWRDADFKERLLKDPGAALAELGFTYFEEAFLRDRLEVVVLDYADKGSLSITRNTKRGETAEPIQLTATPTFRYRPRQPPMESYPPMESSKAQTSMGEVPKKSRPRPTNGWQHFGPNLRQTLILRLPPKPTTVDDVALAIADYEAAGRVYSQTIC